MNQNFQQLIKTFKMARLSRVEKRAGWEYLARELNLTPTSNWTSLTSLLFSRQTGYVLATLILTLALGAGASQAAEGAVPGDIFYPLKTKVKEPVERLLVPNTPAAQATFETNLVERRLDEAEKLIKENKLDSKRKSEIKLEVTEQTARAAIKEQEKDQDKVEIKAPEPLKTKSTGTERKLKNVLDEHQDILNNLDLQTDVKEQDKEDGHESNVRNTSSERHNKGKREDD